jgi:hypothetical protein
MNEPQVQAILQRLDRLIEIMQWGRKKKKKWKFPATTTKPPATGEAEAVRVAEQKSV